MNSFVVLCFGLLAVASAEPPRSNSRFSRQFQRQEAAPYPPSGWRPSGPQLQLPEPQTSYGPPPQEYGPPSQEYGPPQEETTTASDLDSTTTEIPITTTSNPDLDTEELGSGDDDQKNEALTNEERGFYYIYHPSGLLQRVNFATNDDVKNMAFSARLKYENVEPIRGPVFTYDPVTFAFTRL
ncbi:uncharacterized protein [Leptinotarsa decemlineata]|uniref:uncharacterized protein n=1 Tax=Leptinotarsa decemlineata TaxID=7539 RepID=UPI003D304CC2